MSECKAFNDRQTVLGNQDETERLRVACIKQFSFPMSEKIKVIIKCSVRSLEYERAHSRLIILTNFLVLDPEYFGPEISSYSFLISLRKIRAVNPVKTASSCKVLVSVLGQGVDGLDIEANVTRFEFEFHTYSEMLVVYNLLSLMCRKAESLREREKFKPFETPSMTTLLENCCKVHHVKAGETIDEASKKSSLFLVRVGEIRLITNGGEVFKVVRGGGCFGEIAFALEQSVGFRAEAVQKSVVLEISPASLRKFIKSDVILGARFYYILSEVIEMHLRETLEEAFPGSWCQKHPDDAIKSSQHANRPAGVLATPSVRRGGPGNSIENRTILLLQKQAQALQVMAEAHSMTQEFNGLTSSAPLSPHLSQAAKGRGGSPVSSRALSRAQSDHRETSGGEGGGGHAWAMSNLPEGNPMSMSKGKSALMAVKCLQPHNMVLSRAQSRAQSRDSSLHGLIQPPGINSNFDSSTRSMPSRISMSDIENFDIYLEELKKENDRIRLKMTLASGGIVRRTASNIYNALSAPLRMLGSSESDLRERGRPSSVPTTHLCDSPGGGGGGGERERGEGGVLCRRLRERERGGGGGEGGVLCRRRTRGGVPTA